MKLLKLNVGFRQREITWNEINHKYHGIGEWLAHCAPNTKDMGSNPGRYAKANVEITSAV